MDTEEQSLTAILDGTPAETPVAEQTPTPEPTPEPEANADGRPRDPETGKFVKTGEEEPTPGNPIPDDQFKGYLTEKRKRQELEEKLATLEQQFQQIQQPKEPPAAPPSLWDDEQGWQQHQQRLILSQADQLSRINASEMAARSTHADFQEMFDLFNTMAGQNPAVVQQAMADPHPWDKAYQIAKNHKTMSELGAVDVADLKAKIEAQVREEMAGQQSVIPLQPASLPPSLTAERNVGARTGPAWSGPPPLSELLR
jgi:hypothetical protein